jgi:cytochrome c-type biogenesis protein
MFLAFLAGMLSILSPFVFPILPIVLGAASSAERLGPVALAAGRESSLPGVETSLPQGIFAYGP